MLNLVVHEVTSRFLNEFITRLNIYETLGKLWSAVTKQMHGRNCAEGKGH